MMSVELIKRDIEGAKRVVKECRREFSQIESITFSQSKETFDWVYIGNPYVVIDISTKEVDYQVQLMSAY
jgi:hypothetical protein